jgi:hypothetical protein
MMMISADKKLYFIARKNRAYDQDDKKTQCFSSLTWKLRTSSVGADIVQIAITCDPHVKVRGTIQRIYQNKAEIITIW